MEHNRGVVAENEFKGLANRQPLDRARLHLPRLADPITESRVAIDLAQ